MRVGVVVLLLASVLWAPRAKAHEDEDGRPAYRSTVRATDPPATASGVTLGDEELRGLPAQSASDVLRRIPGLMAVQHQGGGKADQLFMRGFDADHGSDVAVYVDGVPVNLPSHAHGQGYVDVRWLPPELIERVEVVKGPYDARQGDFATGGAINFITRRTVSGSSVALTSGVFPTLGCAGERCRGFAEQRAFGLLAPRLSGWAARLRPLFAVEVTHDDGPTIHAQGMLRYNALGKIAIDLGATTVDLMVSLYGASWRSSGLIPSREVEAGRLDRFDAIDPTEGGATNRQQVALHVGHRAGRSTIDATASVTRYGLQLWNDFTLFRVNPALGDQIEQDDQRVTAYGQLTYHRHDRWRRILFRTTVGVQARYDAGHVDLWDSAARRRLGRHVDPTAFGFGNDADIGGLDLAAFVEENVTWRRWLRTSLGLRADLFRWDVADRQGGAASSGAATSGRVSPKLNVVLSPHRYLDLFLTFGMGFHSNDARVSVQRGRQTPDGPVRDVLPAIYAGEVGVRLGVERYFSLSAALWASYLESEIRFSGDDGAFEPSVATRRVGVDVGVRARPLPWLSLDFDLEHATATTVGGGLLAMAPRLFFTAGASARWRGLSGGVRVRHVGERPAFDTDSPEYQANISSAPDRVVAQGYTVGDLNVAYRRRWAEVGLSVQNFTNAVYREAQVGISACTRAEVDDPQSAGSGRCARGLPSGQRTGVTDVHFTPGAPLLVQLTLRATF
jgi:outer membrane receptor protein involved in Fe transport